MTELPMPTEPRWDGTSPRGPVTPDEALAVHLRSWVLGLSRRRDDGAGAPLRIPDRVPSRDDPRQMAAWRIDPEALAYARARAALDGLTLSAVVDRLLRQFAAAPPGTWPTAWATPDADVLLDPPLPGPDPTPPSP